MSKPANSHLLILVMLMAGTFLGVLFMHKVPLNLKEQEPSTTIPLTADVKLSEDTTMNLEVLNELDWQSLDEMLRIVGKDSEKIDQVIQISSNVRIPAVLYLRGFVLMINKQPLQALTVFNELNIRDIPDHFLYPVYRLHRRIQPGSVTVNRYLLALKKAIASGSVSPLIAARVEAQEGDLYSALLNYLRTDPARWVTYDIKCIKRIGQHSGLASEVLRMISGALKSQRLSEEVEKPLRRLIHLEIDSEEVTAFKMILKKELLQDSSSGKIAVSSIKQMHDTRKIFLNRDYLKILSKHQDTNPLMVSNESALILFLSSVHLKNHLETDRWGQEIKRRYPNREVVDWVTELTTSVE